MYKRKNISFLYFCFFAIFYIYIVYVIKYTQFPIMLSDFPYEYNRSEHINLIPFNNIGLRTMFLNVIMTMPFGFGLPFIKTVNWRKIILYTFGFSLTLELVQLSLHLLLGAHDRIVDINDIVANVMGGIIGYLIFNLFIRLYVYVIEEYKIEKNQILNYIIEVSNNHRVNKNMDI